MSGSPELLARYQRVRERSLRLCAPLSAEDAQIQSMTDASPAKWHLAHTTWFFEAFVLAPLGYAAFDPHFDFLFNSYYEAVGERVDRARRGLVTRPGLDIVHAYRGEIDARVAHALVESRLSAEQLDIVVLGIAHEEQHQELLLTDIKHALGAQPLRPTYRTDIAPATHATVAPTGWIELGGGLVVIGAPDGGFAFDCERPRHRVWLEPF